MQQESTLYHPSNDSCWDHPYIDLEAHRENPFPHVYLHGGFEGTPVRFSFYCPAKESFSGRFFHLVTPVQGHEDQSQGLSGEEDHIGFSLHHGACFVESNMGGDNPDPTLLYRSSAAVAEYLRIVAKRLYSCDRVFGYLFGGSGGGFKTMACIERTEGIWDGSVPFVIGSPMAIPNMFTVRVHAMRLLRHRFPQIIDAMEPGGSGDPYAALNGEEADALREATRMGFPPRVWFSQDEIGAGALPVLLYAIDRMDRAYYTDFWTKPGYLGSDPTGSAVRDRLFFETTVQSVTLPEKACHSSDFGVDSAWQTMAFRYGTQPVIGLADIPADIPYREGIKIVITSGAATGLQLPLGRLDDHHAIVGEAFGQGDIVVAMQDIRPGDGIRLDNSDYLAIQTYHRHQVPTPDFCGWDQFRDPDGQPLYPQRPVLIGPITAQVGSGSVQSGRIHGKMIVCASLLDESALPWQADWYRSKICEILGPGADRQFRLWYQDNAMHGSLREYGPAVQARTVSYVGTLHRALLCVSDWAERGIEPPASTTYRIEDAQVVVPASAADRKGIQPTVSLRANGQASVRVLKGETIRFDGRMEIPEGAGHIESVTLSMEGRTPDGYDIQPILEECPGSRTLPEDGAPNIHEVHHEHCCIQPGTYFAALRVTVNHMQGNPYTGLSNLARVRIQVDA